MKDGLKINSNNSFRRSNPLPTAIQKSGKYEYMIFGHYGALQQTWTRQFDRQLWVSTWNGWTALKGRKVLHWIPKPRQRHSNEDVHQGNCMTCHVWMLQKRKSKCLQQGQWIRPCLNSLHPRCLIWQRCIESLLCFHWLTFWYPSGRKKRSQWILRRCVQSFCQ